MNGRRTETNLNERKTNFEIQTMNQTNSKRAEQEAGTGW